MENEKELKQKIEKLKELGCRIILQDLSNSGGYRVNYDTLLLHPDDDMKSVLDQINTKIVYLENRPWISVVKCIPNTSDNICQSCKNYNFDIKHEPSQKYRYERKQGCNKNHFRNIIGDNIPIKICKDYE